ncbi:hypothetical protein SDC9_135533 [bioreactor metagenome]|uniref:Uncharacterized protein n=1 Tax=bioreactor metagenome TaxID=1076179 RepID=A0A645DGL6_9ZZZZ
MRAHRIQHRVAGFELGETAVFLAHRGNDFRQPVELAGAEHEIEMRQLFQQFVAAVLRHAADGADDQVGVARLVLFHEADLADGFALGLFAHAAGVEDHHLGCGLAGDDFVARCGQHPGQRLGIAHVHLAAVGLDENLHRHAPPGTACRTRLSRWTNSASASLPSNLASSSLCLPSSAAHSALP